MAPLGGIRLAGKAGGNLTRTLDADFRAVGDGAVGRKSAFDCRHYSRPGALDHTRIRVRDPESVAHRPHRGRAARSIST